MKKKPYVRYSLEADFKDKGIAYSLKKAIIIYLEHHGFEGKVTDFKATSKKLEATLELYDNGKIDFNINSLYEHLRTSGQLPTQEDLRPKLAIKPLPYDAPSIQTTEDFTAFQKTVDAFHSQTKEKEDTIKALTATLTERQKVIDESAKRITTLEARLERADPRQFDTPSEALRGSYLKNGLATLLELNCDLEELDNYNLRTRFTQLKGEKTDFSSYFSTRTGIKIKTEAELSKWIDETRKYKNWEETKDYADIEKQLARFKADKEVLALAEKSNASPEVIALLKKNIEDSDKTEKELLKQSEDKKTDLEKRREVLEKLEKIKEEYVIYSRIAQNSENRRTRKANFTILEEINDENNEIVYTLPLIDAKGPYENKLSQHIEDLELFNKMKKLKSERTNDENFSFWKISIPTELIAQSPEIKSTIRSNILDDAVLKALGINPLILQLSSIQ